MPTISDPGRQVEGAVRLRQEPEQPSSPCDSSSFSIAIMTFLAWLLANHGQDPLDLLVVESVPKMERMEPRRLSLPMGDTHFLNRKVWADTVGAIPADEDEDKDGG